MRLLQDFRSTPLGVEVGCHYDNQVRQAVLDRLIEDGMSAYLAGPRRATAKLLVVS